MSVIHGVYDPLGLAGPVLKPAKILFQETCSLKLDWYAPLPPQLLTRWTKWTEELTALERYSIPRCCKPGDPEKLELHYFSDGSTTAYGSVVFLRCVYPSGQVRCSPVIAKARLTPLKNTAFSTVPRI